MTKLPLLLTLVVGVALWATPTLAQVSLAVNGTPAGKGCTQWTICDDLTAAGICTNNGTDYSFARTSSEYTWTAFTQGSDSVTAYTVKLYSTEHGGGYDATHRALINSSDITFANPMFSWSGIMGDIYAELGGTTTGGVTVTIKGCMLQGP